MIFDSGAHGSFFFLDSAFLASHPDIKLKGRSFKSNNGSAWTNDVIKTQIYQSSPILKLGNTSLKYDNVYINDFKKFMHVGYYDGLFNIPNRDSSNIWEFNFENNYLEIHSAKEFKMPVNCILLPIKQTPGYRFFNVEVPLLIKFANGDTLPTNFIYRIDTGIGSILLTSNAKEIKFFKGRNDGVVVKEIDTAIKKYVVSARIANTFTIDSLNFCTTYNPFRTNINYFIGLNFLKHFNVFFDLKNNRIGLQPIKKEIMK